MNYRNLLQESLNDYVQGIKAGVVSGAKHVMDDVKGLKNDFNQYSGNMELGNLDNDVSRLSALAGAGAGAGSALTVYLVKRQKLMDALEKCGNNKMCIDEISGKLSSLNKKAIALGLLSTAAGGALGFAGGAAYNVNDIINTNKERDQLNQAFKGTMDPVFQNDPEYIKTHGKLTQAAGILPREQELANKLNVKYGYNPADKFNLMK